MFIKRISSVLKDIRWCIMATEGCLAMVIRVHFSEVRWWSHQKWQSEIGQ